jgi:hypothetical protein
MWELNPAQGGVGFEELLAHFARGVGAFLADVRARVLPGIAREGAAPVTLIWRAINPTVFARVDAERAPFLAVGRAAAANALVRAALDAWNADARSRRLPLWRVIDTFDLMPTHLLEVDGMLAADGFHPGATALRNIADAALSEACGGGVEWRTIEGLGEAGA